FFSSRRRHTRFSRDWSSDVCSSDLVTLSTKDHRFGKGREISENTFQTNHGVTLYFHDAKNIAEEFGSYGLSEFVEINEPTLNTRSEERRVGKECRYRRERSRPEETA